jgi:hypothetical protein
MRSNPFEKLGEEDGLFRGIAFSLVLDCQQLIQRLTILGTLKVALDGDEVIQRDRLEVQVLKVVRLRTRLKIFVRAHRLQISKKIKVDEIGPEREVAA